MARTMHEISEATRNKNLSGKTFIVTGANSESSKHSPSAESSNRYR